VARAPRYPTGEVRMILNDEQMRWCAAHLLGIGYDDDDDDKVQHAHLCETIRGGTKPATLDVGTRTRRKLVRERRARNAFARVLLLAHHERPHLIRERWDEHDPRLPRTVRACDCCARRLGHFRFGNGWQQFTSVRQRHGWRDVYYCRDCCATGAAKRDQERRTQAGVGYRPTQPRSKLVTLCRSPRLWFGLGEDYTWPDPGEEREITCLECLRLLAERGCPSAS